MSKVERYLGLILRASVSSKVFWEQYGVTLPEETINTFLSMSPREANEEAHRMHKSKPNLRREALDLLPSSEVDFHNVGVWLDTEEEAADLSAEINQWIDKMSWVARARPKYFFLYTHEDEEHNPWVVEILTWDKDVTAKHLVSLWERRDREWTG